jgi:hypothetical protein
MTRYGKPSRKLRIRSEEVFVEFFGVDPLESNAGEN